MFPAESDSYLFAKSLDLILCDWLVGIELLNVPLESLDLAHV